MLQLDAQKFPKIPKISDERRSIAKKNLDPLGARLGRN